MNNKQRLGVRVFYYYLSKKVSVGLLVLIAAVIFSSFKESLVLKLGSLIPVATSTDIIHFLVNGFFIISVLLIIFGFISSLIKYISCDFTLDENAFSVRRGFLTKREVSIPYRQIQNINIEQSLSGKTIGIGKLVILTEGDHKSDGKEGEGVFEVIDYVLAHQVREFILQRTNTQTVEPKIQ